MSIRLKKIKAKCRVCKGVIVAKTITMLDPTTGPPIYGPGGKNQIKEIHSGYYCEDCGIKYEFLPEKIKRK